MAPITNSLVFRLFDDKALRMRAMTVMITVGMSGFVLGPLLGGTALAHVSWEWLLVVNAPIALIAAIGVRLGVASDRREDLTDDKLDLPGAALSIAAIGLACYSLTSGVEHGWLSAITLMSIIGAAGALAAFIHHERRTTAPMLDLKLFSNGTVRGATIAQAGTSIAMASVMFGLILHFQYAYGWSPVKAGLANLPIIVTMLAATPLSEWLAKQYGHRIACLVGAGSWPARCAGLSWGVEHGYFAIAVCMVAMTIGLRTVMTICAVALVDAMPSNRTSIGTALNDTAQEVGTSIGTAVLGTLIAVLVTTALPAGTWSSELVASFFHGGAGHLRGARPGGRRGRGGRRARPHRLARDGGAGAGDGLRASGLADWCRVALRADDRPRHLPAHPGFGVRVRERVAGPLSGLCRCGRTRGRASRRPSPSAAVGRLEPGRARAVAVVVGRGRRRTCAGT